MTTSVHRTRGSANQCAVSPTQTTPTTVIRQPGQVTGRALPRVRVPGSGPTAAATGSLLGAPGRGSSGGGSGARRRWPPSGSPRADAPTTAAAGGRGRQPGARPAGGTAAGVRTGARPGPVVGWTAGSPVGGVSTTQPTSPRSSAGAWSGPGGDRRGRAMMSVPVAGPRRSGSVIQVHVPGQQARSAAPSRLRRRFGPPSPGPWRSSALPRSRRSPGDAAASVAVAMGHRPSSCTGQAGNCRSRTPLGDSYSLCSPENKEYEGEAGIGNYFADVGHLSP